MGGRGPTQLEERKSILEEGKSIIKNMSVVKHVVIFLGSVDPVPALLGHGLAIPSPRTAFPSFCTSLSSMHP